MPKLNLIVLRFQDIERAAQFYRLIGLDFIKHSHGSGPEHYAAEMGGMVFELYPRKSDLDSTAGVRIGLCVLPVDESTATLENAGARIASGPRDSPWGKRSVVEDPYGHKVELTEPQV